MTKCPSCSAAVPEGLDSCPSCGSDLDVSSLMTETGFSGDSLEEHPPVIGSPSGPSANGISSEVQGSGGEHQPGAILAGVVMAALLRYGLLTLISLVFVINLLQASPPVLSMSNWYSPMTFIPPFVVLICAVAAFAASLGRQQWFGAD